MKRRLIAIKNLDPDRFFQVIGDGVRRHSFKLYKRRYHLGVGKFAFASRVYPRVITRGHSFKLGEVLSHRNQEELRSLDVSLNYFTESSYEKVLSTYIDDRLFIEQSVIYQA